MRASRPRCDNNPVERLLNAPPRTAQLRAPVGDSAILSVVAWPPFGDPGGRAVPSSESCGDNNYGLVPLPYDDVVGVGRLPLPCTLPGNPNLRIEDQLPRTVDENIAAPLADKLDKAGHDVERVVNVSELGEGVDDTTICQYAVQEGRLIVTSDDDFVQMPADSHCGVFYVPDQSLPRTTSTTSSSALSKRSPVGRRWRQ